LARREGTARESDQCVKESEMKVKGGHHWGNENREGNETKVPGGNENRV